MKTVPAIILAAGFSSRMGAFKPLLPLGGTTVIGHLVNNARQAGLSPVVVVTGYGHKELEAALEDAEKPVVTVFNSDYADGMFTSIKTGIRYLKESLPATSAPSLEAAPGMDVPGCLLFLVDTPLAGADAIRAVVLSACEEGNAERFAVPTYRGKKGHPLYIPQKYWDEILTCSASRGLKDITDRYEWDMNRVPVEDEGVVLDMDDREAYEEVLDLLENGSRSLSDLAAGRRIILVRHGQIRQHKEKIFLGQTDVPLSDLGLEQAGNAVSVLAEMGIRASCIYTSPLRRASQTAGVIADRLRGREDALTENGAAAPHDWRIHKTPELSEMSLGEWDGRPIREIREAFPEAYERRGRDLFVFKTAGGENFYDLQYRAVHALKKILKEDASQDILLVAHRGVIRALENTLCGGGVEDSWEDLPPGGIRTVDLLK